MHEAGDRAYERARAVITHWATAQQNEDLGAAMITPYAVRHRLPDGPRRGEMRHRPSRCSSCTSVSATGSGRAARPIEATPWIYIVDVGVRHEGDAAVTIVRVEVTQHRAADLPGDA